MTAHTPDARAGTAVTPLFDPAWLPDPFPHLARLRAEGPLVPVSLPPHFGASTAWLVTRMEEAVLVLKDRRFTVDPSLLDMREALGQTERALFGGRSMINVDGLDHTRLRGLVARVFTPRYIQGLRPAIQRLADALLDRVQARGRMDLVQDFALPLPIDVISDMLGVPPDHRRHIRTWSEALSGIAPGHTSERRAKLLELTDYVQRLLDDKRRQPQADLLSELIALEEAGDRLSEQELVSTVALLIFAGHETTANLISTGALMLLEHPAQLALLQADLSLVPQAVEELLRFSSPVLLPGRRLATEDLELGGQRVRRGDSLMISLAAASRDPAAFADPDELRIARDLSRQIAFGQGVHICLGAPLARLEGEIAFTTLLRRMPNLRLDIPRAALDWRGSLFVRRLKELPVAW